MNWRRRFGPFLEIFRAIKDNRDRPGYAWRILNKGVCDGCALGTTGMKDWTLSGTHLCWIRLNLLRLNTAPPFAAGELANADALRGKSEAELRKMGRLPHPFMRRAGEPGFTAISWDRAMQVMTERWQGLDPQRAALYVVSRGTANETYYGAQKAWRALGSNHIDNSARICHSPSTNGLKRSVGYAATTCSYKDLMGSDLVVFVGSDVANNQPVMMKYLHLAKKEGTQVAMINPFREPGMERYWVPSSVDSALFGTGIVDHDVSIRVGGDIAFINGVLKHLIAMDAVDREFITAHTNGWEELEASLATQSFEELAEHAGTSVESMRSFAALYARSRHAIFVWSMGVTMHKHGVDNVLAIANLALARGNVGRPKSGLMPIRGHSGVQGGSEMGCGPNLLPGGETLSAETARTWSDAWGFRVPEWKGWFVAEMIDAAHRRDLDFLYCVGSNLFGVLPDSTYVREALERIPLRVHHDIVFNPQMLVDPADTVLLLPATTRYEMAEGNTETSTERRVIYNPEIPGPRVTDARDEWRVLAELAARVRPETLPALRWPGTAAIRAEIGRWVPLYEGIQHLAKAGDQFQWGGPMLGKDGQFGLPDRRAQFNPVLPQQRAIPPGHFQISTRRGKQFNSMVWDGKDSLVGATRDEVTLAESDLLKLGLTVGDPVTVRTPTGELTGPVRVGELHPGTVMVHWPEANVLLPRGEVEPECGIPAYRDAVAEVVPVTGRGHVS